MMLLPFLAAMLVGPAPVPDEPKPPEGFVAMFNGKDLTGWKTDEHDAPTHWTVKDGVLHYDGKGDSLRSARDYGDFVMYVDWKIAKDADSGIYVRGLPQIQIWDRPDIGSGGLYNNKVGKSVPDKIADRPIGEWNTFKIEMRGDRVTVFLNGEKVVDNVALEHYPEYKTPIPTKGTIELQHHGNPLEFRNIYIKEL